VRVLVDIEVSMEELEAIAYARFKDGAEEVSVSTIQQVMRSAVKSRIDELVRRYREAESAMPKEKP